MDLRKLRQVATIARTSSFSRAAEELHITQPALSRSIASIEQQFGVRLFERGRSGVTLTPVGRMVVDEAENLLRQAGNLRHNLSLYGRGEAGRINFGMGPLIASMVLPALSGHFMTTRPQLVMAVLVNPAGTLIRNLMNDDIEMFFCTSSQIQPGVEIRIEPIGSVSLALLVRSGHPLAGQSGLSLDDLAPFPMASGAELSTAGTAPAQGAFICDNYHILRETILNSDCIWTSSPQLSAEDIKAGQLIILDLIDNPRPPHTEVGLIRRTGRTLTPAAEAVLGYVVDFFGALNTDRGERWSC
jgi:DNA-binding transcriptional LysR family regulator